MEERIPASLTAEVFLSIGTSGHVYPAAGFVAEARQQGALTIEVNLEPSANSEAFDAALYGPAGEILPPLVDAIMAGFGIPQSLGDDEEQPITGFHQDEAGDWVAELVCGHYQHVRHQPPWINRPWVMTVQGRQEKLGRSLNCRKCAEGAPPDTSPGA